MDEIIIVLLSTHWCTYYCTRHIHSFIPAVVTPLELGADGWLVVSEKVVSLFRIERISSKLGLACGTDTYEYMI